MLIRAFLTLSIVFQSLGAFAQAPTCSESLTVSNNSTVSSVEAKDLLGPQAEIDLQQLMLDPQPLIPTETELSPVQRSLLRRIFVDLLLQGVSSLFDFRTGAKALEVKDLGQKDLNDTEKDIYKFLATTVQRGQLRYYLNGVLTALIKLPFIGKKLKAKEPLLRGYVINGAVDAVSAIVEMRGMTRSSQGFKFTKWKDIGINATKKIDAGVKARVAKVENSVKDPNYLNELTEVADTRFVNASKIEILVDGEQSYAKRGEMIAAAKESIDIMVWAVLDDYTGAYVAKQLIQRAKEGIKVRVMVDGKVNHYIGYNERVKEMEQNGVEVIRWQDPKVTYVVQHRKILFVDGKAFVGGGINAGDTYSHLNPDPQVGKWRDTDIYVEGDAVTEAYRLFGHLWNQQLEFYPEYYGRFTPVKIPDASPTLPSTSPNAKFALIESQPHPSVENGSPILLAMMKAIRGATKSIDIENAYVVLAPSMREEIRAALKRGVKVRVFTNSDTSVDEGAVSKPIMYNAYLLAKMGAQIFLKKGSTLHSKVMIVDEELSFVKSYNLHPRSERTDSEVAFMISDVEFGKKMTAMFNNDITEDKATAVKRSKDIAYNNGFLDRLMLMLSLRIGYDVL